MRNKSRIEALKASKAVQEGCTVGVAHFIIYAGVNVQEVSQRGSWLRRKGLTVELRHV